MTAFNIIRLRKIQIADLPMLYQFQSDPDASRMAVVNPRSAAGFNAHWAMVLDDSSVVARVIIADELLVGHISCFELDGQRTVGYWIAREHWGRGAASRALALLLDEVMSRPLHARAARSNAASIRVLEKCGFVVTGYQHSPASERYPECEEAIMLLA